MISAPQHNHPIPKSDADLDRMIEAELPPPDISTWTPSFVVYLMHMLGSADPAEAESDDNLRWLTHKMAHCILLWLDATNDPEWKVIAEAFDVIAVGSLNDVIEIMRWLCDLSILHDGHAHLGQMLIALCNPDDPRLHPCVDCGEVRPERVLLDRTETTRVRFPDSTDPIDTPVHTTVCPCGTTSRVVISANREMFALEPGDEIQ